MRSSTFQKVLAVALATGILLPTLALAETTDSSAGFTTSTATTTVKPPKAPKKGGLTADQLAKVQSAVAAREQAITTAATTFGTSVTAAFQKRGTAINAAWALTDTAARKAAVKAAWDTFRNDMKTAKTAYKATKEAAWKTFKTAVQSIKGIETEDPMKGAENIQ